MTNTKIWGSIVAVVAIAVAIVCWASWGYGKISEDAYQFATATYGACLARSPDRLDRLEILLHQPEYCGGMSDQEIRWFEKIIAKTRTDNWSAAAESARRMLEDQVSR